ncbi:MAG: hypothetical protein FWD55_03335 [Propionibacteriaceae bacterium]|nr:hypothetical protein [Propionibacteriaceae bacterium]
MSSASENRMTFGFAFSSTIITCITNHADTQKLNTQMLNRPTTGTLRSSSE